MFNHSPASLKKQPNKTSQVFFNFFALVLVISFFIALNFIAKEVSVDIENYHTSHISLSVYNLPYYALLTTMRIFTAAVFSIIFSLLVGTLAAKSKKAEELIIPLLDILQSVPILGYISFIITILIALYPTKALGVELAVILVIFSSQVWNITLSLYQSLKTVPKDILDASSVFGLSAWKKFWFVEIPFAIPGLIWNVMLSISASWFFIVASEAISVGDITYTLPGIGSYLGMAIEQKNLHAILYSIITTLVLIISYDRLIFQPLIIWARKFKYEMVTAQDTHTSWVYNIFSNAYLIKIIFLPISYLAKKFFRLNPSFYTKENQLPHSLEKSNMGSKLINYIWYFGITIALSVLSAYIATFLYNNIDFNEIKHVFFLGGVTLLRILVLLVFSSIILLFLGIYIGLRPNLASRIQPMILFFAAFPANLLFPVFVLLIIRYDLNPNIWLSPLIILGAQWYILLNVIAGTSAFPRDLIEAASLFNIKGFSFIKKVMLPGILPYLITGIITAAGGAWNASIVAEAVNWGSSNIYAVGLGAYIAQKTALGEYHSISLGVCVMSIYVIALNKLVWRPLYNKAEKFSHLE